MKLNTYLLAPDAAAGTGKEKKEEAPKLIRVEAMIDTPVDGKVLSKGQTMEVTPRQYAALAARLKKVAALAMLALLALSFAGSAKAQTYGTGTVYQDLSGQATNTVAASAISNYVTVVGSTKYEDVGLYIAFKSTTNVVCTNYFFLNYGPATNLLATNSAGRPSFTLQCKTDGSEVRFYTNLYLGNAGYWSLSVSNAESVQAISNLNVRFNYKPSRRGL